MELVKLFYIIPTEAAFAAQNPSGVFFHREAITPDAVDRVYKNVGTICGKR